MFFDRNLHRLAHLTFSLLLPAHAHLTQEVRELIRVGVCIVAILRLLHLRIHGILVYGEVLGDERRVITR